MKHYLYLPFAKCLSCKHLNASGSRAYKCFDADCPATDVQIVVRQSVVDCARNYVKAVRALDFSTQNEVLNFVKSKGRAFEYKFKAEVQSLRKEK